jgi:predicted Zn-dependent protease
MFHAGRIRRIAARDSCAESLRRPSRSVIRTYRGLANLAIGQNNDAKRCWMTPNGSIPSRHGQDCERALAAGSVRSRRRRRKINEVLLLDPRNTQALDVKGVLLLARGNQNDALNMFNAALKEKPDNPQALLDRANLYIGRNELE